MDILQLLIPLSVALVLPIGAGFWWSVPRRVARVASTQPGVGAAMRTLVPDFAFGSIRATPLLASAGMAVSSLAVVGNALRLSRLKALEDAGRRSATDAGSTPAAGAT